MLDDQRPGTVYWIDHYVVGTNDVQRWVDFHTKVLGAHDNRPTGGGPRGGGLPNSFFQDLAGPCHHGGFGQTEPLPPSNGLGTTYPRYGLYIRQEDIPEHLARLDANNVPHTDPIRTSAEGESGIAIYWEDPDGNGFEFWGPDKLPEGAMDGAGPEKVGRISHGVFESQDLDRTAAFFNRYCALDAARGADIASDTLVLPLAAGGRLIFKKVEQFQKRTGGWGQFNGPHAALVVRDEDFFPNYERMWAELGDWELDAEGRHFLGAGSNLPARMARHGSPAGRQFHQIYGRGDDWYDFDTNCFHFFGGLAKNGSMRDYEPHSMEYHLDEYLKAHGETPLASKEMR
jgi:hypothetical protein